MICSHRFGSISIHNQTCASQHVVTETTRRRRKCLFAFCCVLTELLSQADFRTDGKLRWLRLRRNHSAIAGSCTPRHSKHVLFERQLNLSWRRKSYVLDLNCCAVACCFTQILSKRKSMVTRVFPINLNLPDTYLVHCYSSSHS